MSQPKKLQFLTKCRNQFMNLNKEIDHTQKWEVYQKAKDVVRTPELYMIVKRGESLPNAVDLPDRFCVKGNRGEQGQQVMLIEKRGNKKYFDHYHKKEYVSSAIVRKFRQMLEVSELLIFEEWLYQDESSAIPFDYKFQVLRGEILYIFVFDRNSKKTRYVNFFDKHWNRLEPSSIFKKVKGTYRTDDPNPGRVIPPTEEQKKILSDAVLNLWKKFKKPHFTRFDVYLVNGQVYFGEVTVVCGSIKHSILQSNVLANIMRGAPWNK